MKTIVLAIFILLQTPFVVAQNAYNSVSTNDFEERIALLYWSKDYKRYAEQLTEFLSIDSTYADRNYFRLGIACLHLKDTILAKKRFKEGIKINVNYPFNYAGLALLTRDFQQQLSLFKKSLILFGKYDADYYSDKRPEKKELSIIIPKTMAWVNHNIGVIYYQTKKYDSANYYFRKAYISRPDDPEHLVALAINQYFYYNGDTKKALKSLKSAEVLSPPHPLIPALKCLFELQNKNFSRALSYIEEAKSGDANSVVVLLLKEICNQRLTPSASFDKNIETIILKDNSFAYIQKKLVNNTSESKIEYLTQEIEKSLFSLSKYYNPQIYPSGGLSNLTYDGQKNTTEKLYIK